MSFEKWLSTFGEVDRDTERKMKAAFDQGIAEERRRCERVASYLADRCKVGLEPEEFEPILRFLGDAIRAGV